MNIVCFRKSRVITREMECRACFFRRRCRGFQLWLQPELPFDFKSCQGMGSALDSHYEIQHTLDSLFSSEYALLKKMALKALPDVEDENSAIVRLKMYEILTGQNLKDCKKNKN